MTQTTPKQVNKRPKVAFTQEEDQIINFFVNLIGTKKWSSIAKFVNGRTAKQCRDRYVNYLKPGLTNIEWTQKEDELLLELYNKHGPKWSTINKNFKNRNQVSIKNRLIFLQKHSSQVRLYNNNHNTENNNLNTKNILKKVKYTLPDIYAVSKKNISSNQNESDDFSSKKVGLNDDDEQFFNLENMFDINNALFNDEIDLNHMLF